MKLKHLQEARLDIGPQNEIIAKWLLNGLEATYDRGMSNAHRLFIGTAMNSGPEGGLENAVRTIQEWNTVIKFIDKHTEHSLSYGVVSPQKLNKWVRHWKAT